MAHANGSYLRGATPFVTRDTRGIGYAVVEELAGLGAIVQTCSRNEVEIDKCLSEWHAKGFAMIASVCDGKDRAQREKLMEKVSSIFNGKLNILVSIHQVSCLYCDVSHRIGEKVSGAIYVEALLNLVDAF